MNYVASLRRGELVSLENVLHYFMVTCKPAVAGMHPMTKAAWEANVCGVAAEEFITCKNPQKIRNQLLDALKKYYDEAKAFAATREPPTEVPTAEEKWMDFSAAAEKAEAKQAEADAKRLLPKLITYDDRGAPVNAQDTAAADDDSGDKVLTLPWREWHLSAAAEALGKEAADMAVITLALRTLHANPRLRQMQVEVRFSEASKKQTAVASSDINAATLELPPCVPKSGKIHTSPVHPLRVPIVVKRIKASHRVSAKASVQDHGSGIAAQTTTYYLHPEFKLPEDAAPPGAEAAAAGVLAWKWTGDETMHPFWAVQRLAQHELRRKNIDEPRSRPLQFNVQLLDTEFNTVTVGRFADESITTTYQVVVPMMTNTVPIKQGDPLVLEHVAQTGEKKRKEYTWKDKVGAKAASKAKTKPAVKPKATMEV